MRTSSRPPILHSGRITGFITPPAGVWNCRCGYLANCWSSGGPRNLGPLVLAWPDENQVSALAPIPLLRSRADWKRSALAPDPARCPPALGKWQRICTGSKYWSAPYAVAHLRLTQALEGVMNDAKAAGEPEEKLSKRLNIYL